MFGQNGVAFDELAAEIAVNRVQVEPVRSRNQAQRGVEVSAEFLGGAGFAGIIAGRLNASAAQGRRRMFESADIIALPAMQGNWECFKRFQGRVSVHAQCGILLFCERVTLFNLLRIHVHTFFCRSRSVQLVERHTYKKRGWL